MVGLMMNKIRERRKEYGKGADDGVYHSVEMKLLDIFLEPIMKYGEAEEKRIAEAFDEQRRERDREALE